LTDADMTRFWMTPEEAVQLVLFAAGQGAGRGEIFVPELPAFNMVDLLRALLGDRQDDPSAIEVVGVRPGEKLHETLLTREEMACSRGVWQSGAHVLPFRVFAVQPWFHAWAEPLTTGRYELPEWHDRPPSLETYNSQTWPIRLTVADIRARLTRLAGTGENDGRNLDEIRH